MTAMAYPQQWRGPGPWEKRCARMSRHRHHGNRAFFGPGGPGFGPGFGPPFGPRGRRAARGDVRAAVLLLLAEEPRNGYALMQEIEERSEGVWRPSPGSIYPALAQLEDEGLVEATKEGSGRVFALTDAPDHGWLANRGPGLALGAVTVWSRSWPISPIAVAITTAVAALVAFVRVERHRAAVRRDPLVDPRLFTTGDQRKRAVELLTEARRGLYRILSEDEPADE